MHRSSGLIIGFAVLAAVMFPTATFAATGPIAVPGAPANVNASAGTLSATVRWAPSGATATSYTVVSSPGGVSATVDGTVTSATVTGLGFLMSYTFAVSATNSIGTGPASALSNAITPLPPGGPYHQGFSLVLVNTNLTVGHPISTNFGDDPVHLPGISAVVVNVTTSQAPVATSVQIVMNQRIVQAIEAGPGRVESSLAVVPVPAPLTQAAIQVSSGSAHVEVDFVGYFTGPSSVRDHSGLLQMVHANTLLDTSVATGASIDIPVLGQGEIPGAHVAGVLLNVTALSATGTGSFALRPSGTFETGTTTIGFAAGQTTANRAIVALPAAGGITLVDRGAAAGVRIEVLGWFTDATDATAIGSLYSSIVPVRLVDTASHGGQLPAGASVSFGVWGQGGAPGGSATAPPTSALLQIAALSPAGSGSIAISGVSVVDFTAGQTRSRVDVVKLAGDGSASLTVVGAAANVTVDLVAFFSGDMIVPGSTKVLSAAILGAITNLGSDLSITFAAGSRVSPPILLNDVIVASVSPTTPKGFLRRVLSISNLPTGEVVLRTRYAHLQEAVTAFSVEWVMPPNSGTFGASLSSLGSTAVAAVPTAAKTSFPPPLGTSIDPNWPVFSVAKPPQGLVVDLTNVIGGASELDINDLEFQALPHFKMTGNPFTGGTVHVAVGFSVGVRAAIELQLLGTINRKLKLFDEFFSSVVVVIFIGPVPLVFQPGTEVQITLQVSLNGGVAVGFNLDRFGALSAGYDGTNFFIDPPVYKDYLTTAQSYTIRPVLQAQAEADVHIIPSLAFYDRLLSVGAEVKPYLRLTVDPTAPHWWSLAAGICRALTLDLNLYFDQKAASFLPLCIEVEIAHAPGAKLIVTLLPTSATVARSGTAHFQAGVANSNNGVIWSITEGSAGGSLSNANQIDVDYKAPSLPGVYHIHAAAIDDSTSFTEAVITVPASAPSPPQTVTAVAGTPSATVTWAAPADNGGVALTGYQVTSSPDGVVVGVGATTQVASFTGLTPGTVYTFTVTATNSAGLTSAPSPPSPPIQIPPAGPMSVTPTALDFGTVPFGQTSQPQTVTVVAGVNPLVVAGVALAGTRPGDFAIQSDLCSSQTIQPGGSCTFAVVYKPTIQASVSAVATITDDDPSSPQSVNLTGTAPVQARPGLHPVWNIQMIDSQLGYIVEGGGLMKTIDGGNTWALLPTPSNLAVAPAVFGMHFIDASHGFVLACLSGPLGTCGLYRVISTSDGGQTWQVGNLLPDGVSAVSLWFTDSLHGWVTGDIPGPPPPPGSPNPSVVTGMYATSDGGLSWTKQTLSDPFITAGCTPVEINNGVTFADSLHGGTAGTTLCFPPSSPFFTSRNVVVWSTSDGGANWTAHALPSNVPQTGQSRLEAPSASQLRVPVLVELGPFNVESDLAVTNDSGASFTLLPLPAFSVADLQFSDASNGFLVSNDKAVFRTADAGVSWVQVATLPQFQSSAGPFQFTTYSRIDAADANNIWLVGFISYLPPKNVGAGFIEHSSDGGATWTFQWLGDGT